MMVSPPITEQKHSPEDENGIPLETNKKKDNINSTDLKNVSLI